VLLNRATAEGIADGSITLVLRRWDVPRAKPGGTQRTPVGTVRIDAVTEHPGGYRVTAGQAAAAGFSSAKAAQTELDRRPAKHTYLIAVSYLAPTNVQGSPPTTCSPMPTSPPSPHDWTAGMPSRHRGPVNTYG
jgi:hypothetical protein